MYDYFTITILITLAGVLGDAREIETQIRIGSLRYSLFYSSLYYIIHYHYIIHYNIALRYTAFLMRPTQTDSYLC